MTICSWHYLVPAVGSKATANLNPDTALEQTFWLLHNPLELSCLTGSAERV